jgi:hypothetical protein
MGFYGAVRKVRAEENWILPLRRRTRMPAVELCEYCYEKIDTRTGSEEYVIVATADGKGSPRKIAHPKCVKENSGPVRIERG